MAKRKLPPRLKSIILTFFIIRYMSKKCTISTRRKKSCGACCCCCCFYVFITIAINTLRFLLPLFFFNYIACDTIVIRLCMPIYIEKWYMRRIEKVYCQWAAYFPYITYIKRLWKNECPSYLWVFSFSFSILCYY